MYHISAAGYINAGIVFLKIERTDEIWPSMKDIGSGLGVKNISDLVKKEISGVYGKKGLTKKEIKNYKMTEREIYEKCDNLSKDELNIKSNKNFFVKNIIMTNIIKHCRGEKKRNKSNRRILKKLLMIINEISVCPEHEVKSKIGIIFVNEEILQEHSVKVYEIDPYFYEHHKKRQTN